MIDGLLLFIGGGGPVPLVVALRTVFQHREALSDRQEAPYTSTGRIRLD